MVTINVLLMVTIDLISGENQL